MSSCPEHIKGRERGAWGEQKTARSLRRLRSKEWLVRHDLATGYRKTNFDHLVVGPAVYLLDSKLLVDEVQIRDGRLYVHRLDASHGSLRRRRTNKGHESSRTLFGGCLGARGGFAHRRLPGRGHLGPLRTGDTVDASVAYVAGDKIAEWLLERPIDIHDEAKRRAVRQWALALPRAG
jgi:hypothetical protein